MSKFLEDVIEACLDVGDAGSDVDRRRHLGIVIWEEIADRNTERLGDIGQTGGANAVRAVLVLLQLLETDAYLFAEAARITSLG